MQTRRLGRTGHESSIAVLGGAAFWRCSPEEARVAFEGAIERGVNHLDIAPSYGDAERLIGPLVPAVRDRLFVAGKTQRRNPGGARVQLEETLRLLGTDRLDLYQLHAVTSVDELAQRDDVMAMILQARRDGLVRFVGITGHDLGAPRAHLEAIRRWDVDTVMVPVYPRVWADPAYRSDAEALLAACVAGDVGVMAIKAAARRPWGVRERGPQTWADTWYEPWLDPEHVALGVGFALSTPGVHAFCTPGDRRLLALALDAAESFVALGPAERDAAMAAVRDDPLIFPLVDHAPR